MTLDAAIDDARSLNAVIFDFDGTLVDTMPVHFEAYRRAFADVGMKLAPADFYPVVGGSARETIPRFLRGRDPGIGVDELHAIKKRHAVELLARGVPTLATAGLLPLLHGRVPLAVASSGSRSGVDLVIDALGWRRYFATVVTGEDAARGKPAPDLFLLAAARIAVEPWACLVFEDTNDGVEAAQRAGMSVIDVRRCVAPTSALHQVVGHA